MASRKAGRDIEKSYTRGQFVAKLRRFADSVEQGEAFVIQIAGERIHVPARAVFNIEHEREVAIFDILESNAFAPDGHDGGADGTAARLSPMRRSARPRP